jgi:actin-related protein
MKKQLYGNIIITGGNSLIKGLVNDIQVKVGELAP